MSHFTDTLNPAQKEAVLNYDKPSLIVAGAGSGKTRVLTSRIAYMIEQGVHPGSILALTFTNKAAREMRERIEQLVPDGRARYIWMGTFHSVFYRILRQEAGRLGFDANFTIYDTANSESLLSTIIKERNLNTDEYKPRDIHSRISLAKNNLVTAEAYAANTSFVAEDRQRKRPEFSAIFLEYARRCKANNAMDFDDLLIYANILFRDFPDALEQYRNRFRYILVDEYQDTNYAQYLIVRRLAQTHSNVCVVGDDAQSIYSFRGAKIENILRFQNDFPEAKVFKLEQNYRSTQNIVNAANSIIAKNDRQIPKHVFSENDEGDRVKVLKAYTDQEEAYLVADLAKREGRENGGRWNEIAVLYRNNSQSRAIEDALRRRDVPYRIYSGHSFYDRKEIKDLVAYFRLIVNPRDNEALRRIINTPARGIGAVTVARVAAVAAERGVSMWEVLEGTGSEQVPELKTAAKKLADFTGLIRSLSLERSTKPLHEFGLEVATRSGLIGSYRMNPSPESENALENINELLSSMQNFKEERIVLAYEEDDGEADAEPTVEEWLQNISLMTDMDKEGEDSKNRVVLMTVHSAKGLEFDTVFIVGVEENLNGIEGLTATVYDTTGKEVDRVCSWEAQELESKGISVATDGTMTISQPGTFHVRAFIDGVYSDWAEVIAAPAPVDPMTTVVETPVSVTSASTGDSSATTDSTAPAQGEQAASDTNAVESAPASDNAAAVTDDTAPTAAKDASPIPTGLVTVLTDICRYGIDHGLISTSNKEEMTKKDFDILGILYLMADSQDLVPQDAEDAMNEWVHDNYNDEELATWKQHALSVLLEYGYIAPGTTVTTPTTDGADGA